MSQRVFRSNIFHGAATCQLREVRVRGLLEHLPSSTKLTAATKTFYRDKPELDDIDST